MVPEVVIVIAMHSKNSKNDDHKEDAQNQ